MSEFEEIREQILSDIANNIEGANIERGSAFYALASVLAHHCWGIRKKLAWVKNQAFANTADFDHLIRHASPVIGLPKRATGSVGKVIISGDEDASFEAGLEFSTSDGILFRTTEGGTIPAGGSIIVNAESIDTGARTNVPEDTKFEILSPPPKIDSTAEAADDFDGGTDDESREEYLARYLSYLRTPPAGGTLADFARWALEVEGVDRAKAFGPHELGDEYLGKVLVVPVAEGGSQVSPETISAVEDYIEERRPVCSKDCVVMAHTDKPVTIDVQILTTAGYEFGDFGETKTAAAGSTEQVIVVSPSVDGMAAGDYVIIANEQRKIASINEGENKITLNEPLTAAPEEGEEILPGGPLWDELWDGIDDIFSSILPGEKLYLAQIFQSIMSSSHVISCWITEPTADITPAVDVEKVEMCVLARFKPRRWTA